MLQKNSFNPLSSLVEAVNENKYTGPTNEVETKLRVIWSEILKIDAAQIGTRDNFFSLGGYSLDAIQLVARIRNDFQIDLPLSSLFEVPTIEGIAKLLLGKTLSSIHQFPEMPVDKEHKYDMFPLTDIQESFLVGRQIPFLGSNVGCHCYLEIREQELDIFRLNNCWERLVTYHDMLRVVILPDGQQYILENAPSYKFIIHDLKENSEEEFSKHLYETRKRMSHRIYEPGQFPFFGIEISIGKNQQYIIHLSIDELIVDAWSLILILAQWNKLYKNPTWILPTLEISFRDYVLALKDLETTSQYHESLLYWLKELEFIPDDPLLSKTIDVTKKGIKKNGERRTLTGKLSSDKWEILRNYAKKLNIAPSMLLLTLFSEVIAFWSDKKTFSILLTVYNRLPFHSQIKNLIGPFTSTLIFVAKEPHNMSLLDKIKFNQDQVWRGLGYSEISGIRIQRELKAQSKVHSFSPLGIVFTSLISNHFSIELDKQEQNWFHESYYKSMQTPQIYLDHQVWEQEDALYFNWYIMEDVFQDELLVKIFESYCDILSNLSEEKISWEEKSLKNILQKNVPVPAEDSEKYQNFPLTDIQQAYVFDSFDEVYGRKLGCTYYQEFNITDIDVKKLNNTWQSLIKNHGMLRTIISTEGVQKTLEKAPQYDIEVIDLREYERQIKLQKLEEIRTICINKIFLFNTWPYFELKITLLDKQSAILHFNIDLIIADGASIHLLLQQLFQSYENPKSKLLEPSLSFKAYVTFFNGYNQSANLKISMEYWLSKFSHIPSGPPLLFQPKIKHKRLSKRVNHWDILQRKAKALNISPDIILFTAYAETLSAWFKNRSFTIVVVGWDRLDIHSDPSWSINDLVGDFSHLSWITVNPNQCGSFLEKAADYSQQMNQDKKHRTVGGLKALRRTSSKNGKLLTFPVVYTSLLKDPTTYFSKGIEKGYGLSHTPQVYLDNITFETDTTLEVNWDTLETPAFVEQVEEMHNFYCHLLDILATQPESWNDHTLYNKNSVNCVGSTQPMVNFSLEFILNKCLHHYIEDQVLLSPNDVAVNFLGKELTYEELNQSANQLAYWLRNQGVAADCIVGILVDRSIEMIIGMLAILKAGGAYLPLDPDYPADRLGFMLQDASVSVLLTQAKFSHKNDNFKGETFVLDHDLDTLVTYPKHNLSTIVQSDNLAYVIYTSGSTGKPKGCMLTHKAICNRLVWMQNSYGLTSKDRVLQKTPMTFDVSVWELFWPLMTGASLYFAKPEGHKDSHYLVNFIQTQQMTICHFVPSMLKYFLDEEEVSKCASLRHVFTSGESLPYSLMSLFLDKLPAQLHNLYGPTEAAVDVTAWTCQLREDKKVPIGKPINRVQIYILDEHLASIAPGNIAELYIGGICLARGYLNKPDLTEEKFITSPFNSTEKLYKTGDLALFLEDGNIEYMGRTDSQIKLRGFRIELGEIEQVLLQQQHVKEAVVMIRNERTEDPILVAYLLVDETAGLSPKEVKNVLNQKLPSYMIPSYFIFLQKMPTTAHGKLDRQALPWPLEQTDQLHQHIDKNKGQISSQLRDKVIDIFQGILKAAYLPLDVDLFEIGATSLSMLRATQKIKSILNVNIPIEVILNSPTINGISNYINESLRNESEAATAKLNEGDDVSSEFNFFSSDHRAQLKQEKISVRSFSDRWQTYSLKQTSLPDEKYLLRSAQRHFLNKKISIDSFSQFLMLLKQASIQNKGKYLYPSAGDIYPVQTYLYIKEGAIESIDEGAYYYHPIQHILYRVPSPANFSRLDHFYYNREYYDKAGFCIFFIAQLNVIAPIYGQKISLDFAKLEAGYMGQLLMMHQASFNIGLCPIGGVKTENLPANFLLSESHELVHTLLGGCVDYGQLHQYQDSKPIDKIAIVGMSGRYPGANTIDEFWDNLQNSKISITEMPYQRWTENCLSEGDAIKKGKKYGGFLTEIDRFDHLLFHIAPLEARSMDPQERLFLEIVWECLESSGYTSKKLNEVAPKVGVFVGAMWADYQKLSQKNQSGADFEAPLVSLHSAIANRISYYFNFKGPSIAVDTSCSSTLTALHLACESLQKGECNAAIVGGVNIMSHPDHQEILVNLGLLSQNDKCSAFSHEGTGWVVGEGVGAILLLPMTLAKKNGDYIHAFVKGSAVNHLGKTARYGMPSVNGQIQSIESVINNAGISAVQISYIETAATGSSLADAIEISALKHVFADAKVNHFLCSIGSIKPNIGHLESASGLSQLTKVILQMHHRKIVPTIVHGKSNPLFELEDSPFFIPQTLMEWNSGYTCQIKEEIRKPFIALINAFGATGNCGHVILEEYIDDQVKRIKEEIPQVIILSAATPLQLKEQAYRLHQFLIKETHKDLCLSDIAYTLQVGRIEMKERLAIIATHMDELISRLKVYLNLETVVHDDLPQGIYEGIAKEADHELQLKANEPLSVLAKHWVNGGIISWAHDSHDVKKIRLPTYPFARNSHWYKNKSEQNLISIENNFSNDTLLLGKVTDYLRTVFSKESEIDIEYIDVNIPFENLGINSLLANKLNSRLSRDFSAFSKNLFFEYPTINKLATFIIKQHGKELSNLLQ